MIKMKAHKLTITIGVLILMVVVSASCSKKDRGTQQTADEKTGTISADENTGVLTADEKAHVDLAALETELVPRLLEIENSIINDPTNVKLRKQFVRTATDDNAKKVRAVGVGKPPPDSRDSEKMAKRAAIVDSYRWLAYLQKWRLDPSQPDFGQLSGELPASQVLFVKMTPENGAIALAETDL